MPPQMNCLAGCTGDASLAGYTYLQVNFQDPVQSVTATEYSNINNPSGLQAFDSAGDLIGFCAFTSSSCYTALWTQGSSGPPTTYVPGTFTVSGDISTVLITSFDFAPVQISEVTYVPLPNSIWLLLTGLGGLGCCLLRRPVAIARARPLLT